MKYSRYILVIILAVGLFTRSYQLYSRYYYSHDSDLSAWIVKDLIIDRHPRLIGQLTSSPGIFVGPLFYYSLIPFYFFSNLDPTNTVYFSLFVGLFAVISTYYVFSHIWSKRVGIIGSFLYAASYSISQTEREVVPTTPVFLWTIWYLYSLNLLKKGDKSGLLLSTILFSLVWHIHLALGLLVFLSFIVFLYSWRRFKLSNFVLPLIVGLLLSSPLILFEAKHNFSQAQSLLVTFGSATENIVRTPLEKTIHVLNITVKNANWIFWDRPIWINPHFLPSILVIGLVYSSIKHSPHRTFLFYFSFWILLFIVFFVRHPINLSEYYLNSFNILWIAALAITLSNLGRLGVWLTAFLIIGNLWRLVSSPINAGSYPSKKALVDYIASDMKTRQFPCAAVSYMTDPGHELGYRFLYYRQGLHINHPDSNAPVYTIVFPHSRANRLDATFGSLGLVLPEYSRYTTESIAVSCSGANSNLTDPMFGFTR